METIASFYNLVFYERSDPRVKDWLLLSSPKPLVIIISSYLFLIKFVLPKFMENRKPYQLRNVIKWYNVLQIISNAVVTWGIMTSGWTTTYHFGCVLPDYSMNPEALRMLRFFWWTMILKLLELVETAFFLLRKKENQASFLHIYHHVSTLILIWIGVKYIGGGMVSFAPMLNNSVHVVMYTYYLLSSEGSPTIKGLLNKYKKWITIMQMVQFTLLLVHSSQVFLPDCNMSLSFAWMYCPNVIFVYYMFYKFFKANYGHSVDKKGNLNVNKVKKTPKHN
ncbi:elongation of very long chain fatty acids protein AAEL008004-like [Nymphalis io]|uniref:elongation of very long chain fatty acids protein AAEL008004-like n=1 Tax=Inachis io TaxID=171585 RepID=UPI0021676720|nr:elongation of very long chain fatty acids protein AAEL008004-like [Nymphalis io]